MQRIILVNCRPDLLGQADLLAATLHLAHGKQHIPELGDDFRARDDPQSGWCTHKTKEEERRRRELALVIDLDNGENEVFSRKRAAECGADVSFSVELH